MAETAKFSSDNASAVLMYAADYERGLFDIKSLDEEGYQFLEGLDLEDTITLENSHGQWKLSVVSLKVNTQDIQCEAKVTA